MAGGYDTTPTDPLDLLRLRFIELRDKVRELERPTGTQLYKSVEELTKLVDDLPGQIYAVLATAVNTGTVNAADAYVTNAPLISNNITTGRASLWGRTSDGWVGNTTSSRREKTNIIPAGIDPLAVLAIEVKHYSYIAEVRKRDDPTYPEYVGPDYHVAVEVGAIAEDLHDAGLWEFVVYEQEIVDQEAADGTIKKISVTKLGEDGEPIPQSIHYTLWALAVHTAVQHVYGIVLKQEKRITALENRFKTART